MFVYNISTYDGEAEAFGILAKFPVVLSKLEHEDVEPSKLFRAVKGKMHDVGEFIEVLDCLYALGKIRLIDEEGVLHYVDRDSV